MNMSLLIEAATFICMVSVFISLNSIFLYPNIGISCRKKIIVLGFLLLSYLYLNFYLTLLGPAPIKSVLTFVLLSAYLGITLQFFIGTFSQKMLVILLQLLFMFVIQNILSLLFYLTIGIEGVQKLIVSGFDLDIPTTVVQFGLFLLLKRMKISPLYQLPTKLILLQIAIISSCLFTNLGILLSGNDYFSHIFVGILVLLCIYLSITERHQRINQKNQLENHKYQQLENYYQELEAYHNSIQLAKHDWKNQLIILEGYIQQGDLSLAEKQLHALSTECEEVVFEIEESNTIKERTE